MGTCRGQCEVQTPDGGGACRCQSRGIRARVGGVQGPEWGSGVHRGQRG